MKKSISILLSLIMVLSIFTIVPLSASADDMRYFDYRVIGDDTAEITGYTGISSFIDIPSAINGLTVTSIGDWAFNGYGRMTEINIPDTVTNIGEGAFWECKGLTEVFIPASVTSISDSAFYDCTSLTRFKVDGSNPAYRSLNGDLYDKSAETLIQYASGKTATSFTIPDSVVTIKEGAFIFSCLTEITVPKSVRNIDDYAIGYKYGNNYMPEPIDGFIIKGFVGTAAKLYATDNEITFVALESDPGSDYEYTVLEDGTAEITGYTGNGGNIEIPPTLSGHFVTRIVKRAFYYCSSLTSVTIPDPVTTIGYEAFSECRNLIEVTIPDSVTAIGKSAFGYYNGNRISGFTIKGYTGTVAEIYANNNNFHFISSGNVSFLLGDVDNDNVVGVIDATYIQRYDAGFDVPISEEDILARGDVDGDEEVTVLDATYIQRYDAGFSTPYPIGEPIA